MTTPTRKTRLFARPVERRELIDLVRQRWIVERAAVTLYELALARLDGHSRYDDLRPTLARFRDREQDHGDLLERLLAELGHDPLAQPPSPSTSVGAREMAALVAELNTPGLAPRHVLEVLLLAERLDNVGWQILIELAKEGQLDEDYLRRFRAAGREEAEHEHVTREHLLAAERDELFAPTGPNAT